MASHRRRMIRFFALSFSAVTLRVYLPLASVLGLEFLLTYRTIAWTCWVPSLSWAEWYMVWRRNETA